MPHALFVLAHQDDEIAMAARMKHLLREGWTLSVVYLTNGTTPEIRDDEARAALSCIGVELARVHFFGFPDGSLVDHLDEAFEMIERLWDGRWQMADGGSALRHPPSAIRHPSSIVDAVYCLAWEGGHHDHDASHLIAVALATRRNLPCIELPIYHGHRTPGAVFRSFAPLGNGWTARRITMREGLDVALLCRFHPSQRRTWMALLPEALLRLVVGRKEWTRPASIERLRAKPHAGRLYYERRFGVTWMDFEAKSRSFVTLHFP
jgi:LmbE family N-acetylglucosaminyl deacetylase